MYLAKVMGSLVATQKDPQLQGLQLRIIQPVDSDGNPIGDSVIATDTVGSGVGELIFYITASEAVIPLERKPALSDATIIGIVDRIDKA